MNMTEQVQHKMPQVSDDMIRAAINAHGSSQGPNEWEWMRDALLAALALKESK